MMKVVKKSEIIPEETYSGETYWVLQSQVELLLHLFQLPDLQGNEPLGQQLPLFLEYPEDQTT